MVIGGARCCWFLVCYFLYGLFMRFLEEFSLPTGQAGPGKKLVLFLGVAVGRGGAARRWMFGYPRDFRLDEIPPPAPRDFRLDEYPTRAGAISDLTKFLCSNYRG